VPTERRKHPRVSTPFEGTWPGASGAMNCRIADISLGGCFVHSLGLPTQGDRTTVTVTIGPHMLTFEGEVAYVEPRMGFALRFQEIPSDHLQELSRLLKALKQTGDVPPPPARRPSSGA